MKAKIRMDWIPPKAIMEVANVLTLGSRKNREDPKKRKVNPIEEWAAMQRHAWKWRMGQINDEDSNINHLAHVAARALLALEEELGE